MDILRESTAQVEEELLYVNEEAERLEAEVESAATEQVTSCGAF
jgi:hypothetical protein